MEEWLKAHVYLATWLGVPLAIIGMIAKNKGIKASEIDWSEIFIYFAFVISMGVSFTPVFDEKARNIAWMLLATSFGAILISARRR